MSARALFFGMLVGVVACGKGDGPDPDMCGPNGECPVGFECEPISRRCVRTVSVDAAGGQPDAPLLPDATLQDASVADGPLPDAAAAPDAGITAYNCGAFTTSPTWTITPGFHAVVVADSADGLSQPVAVTVAGGAYGGLVYVVNQGNHTITATHPLTGDTKVFVAAGGWPVTSALLTTIVWDADGQFDGRLYVGDQGGDGDADSRIFRVDDKGAATTFVSAPGPGLDDIYGMAFAPPGSGYPAGLYVTGDTDGSGTDWGVYSSSGTGTPFSEVSGVEGIAFDVSGAYGGGLFASRPASGGYAGDDTVSRIGTNGTVTSALATMLPGIHGITFAASGPFAGLLHAASWQSGRLLSIATNGTTANLATGLSLTNYDGNILSFSPDGKVLFVADRLANRLVCIEPVTP